MYMHPIPIPIFNQCRDFLSKLGQVWPIPVDAGLFVIPSLNDFLFISLMMLGLLFVSNYDCVNII